MEYKVIKVTDTFARVELDGIDVTDILLMNVYGDTETSGLVFHHVAQALCDAANGVK